MTMPKKKHPDGYWTKEKVFEESKNYITLSDFNNSSKSAASLARKYGWIDEMVWLERKRMKRGTWQIKSNVFAEARKYHTKKEFKDNNSAAYSSAAKHKWLNEIDWFETIGVISGTWMNHDVILDVSKNYHSKNEFRKTLPSAYSSAWRNGWLSEMTWLKNPTAKESGYWQIKENVIQESKKYTCRSNFQKKSCSAYNVANKKGWLKEFKWLTPKNIDMRRKGAIHVIYVYVDELDKYAYVGATNDMQERDAEHRRGSIRNGKQADKLYEYFSLRHREMPKYKILLSDLTIKQRQNEEYLQSLYYRDVLRYKLINDIRLVGPDISSLGGLIYKWSKKKVFEKAKEFRGRTITDFLKECSGAYDAALKYKMMNQEIMPWFYENRKENNWWNDKEHVFEESKKYKTLREFEKGSPAAHFAARRRLKCIDEMIWLKRDQVPEGFWQNVDNCIEKSKKYTTPTEFKKGCSAGYNKINDNNLWYLVPWIKSNKKPNGYWNDKNHVFEESRKYITPKEFKEGCGNAYYSALNYGWLDEMTWIKRTAKKPGHWKLKENVMKEGCKYKSRVEFRWGCPGAYRSAIVNRWINDMTWLKRPENYNKKWTKEAVFELAKDCHTTGEVKKKNASAYRTARLNGWFEAMSWITKSKKR